MSLFLPWQYGQFMYFTEVNHFVFVFCDFTQNKFSTSSYLVHWFKKKECVKPFVSE